MAWKSMFSKEEQQTNTEEASGEGKRAADTESDSQEPDRFEGTTVGGDAELEGRIVDVLKTCFDPEIPVNIYELGLIYEIRTADDGRAAIKMTLTSPMCPVAGTLPPEVEGKVRGVDGVSDVRVELALKPRLGLRLVLRRDPGPFFLLFLPRDLSDTLRLDKSLPMGTDPPPIECAMQVDSAV